MYKVRLVLVSLLFKLWYRIAVPVYVNLQDAVNAVACKVLIMVSRSFNNLYNAV